MLGILGIMVPEEMVPIVYNLDLIGGITAFIVNKMMGLRTKEGGGKIL